MKLWMWLLLLSVGVGGVWLLTESVDLQNDTQTASLQSSGVSLANTPAGAALNGGEKRPDELKVYRWKDQNDQWALANVPPPAGTAHEVIDYTPQ